MSLPMSSLRPPQVLVPDMLAADELGVGRCRRGPQSASLANKVRRRRAE